MKEEMTPGFLESFMNEGIYILESERAPEEVEEKGLFEEAVAAEPVAVKSSGGIGFVGSNLKNITVLVEYPNEKVITIKDKLFLKKILEAVSLDFRDVAIVNVKRENLLFGELKLELSPSIVLAFGVDENFFPVKVEKNSIAGEDEKILLSSALHEIASDKNLKGILWKNLKTLFNK